MKNKILFNCTTNLLGGAVKNAALFIVSVQGNLDFNWCFAVSKPVYSLLLNYNVSLDNVIVFDESPSRNNFYRKKLINIADDYSVDVIYTMAGPSYVNFKQFHVMGISNPYITHVDLQGLVIGKNIGEILKVIALTIYQSYYTLKANRWVFQTEESRKGFLFRFFKSRTNTIVIRNAIGNDFIDYFASKVENKIDVNNKVSILCPAAPFMHKSLHLIPDIAYSLKQICDIEFCFILTIDQSNALWERIKQKSIDLSIEKCITTIGSFSYKQAVTLYANSDIVFVPSILETFSASYLEAFASNNPLVVADKGFARDICGNAAVYVDPTNAVESAKIFYNLFNSQNLQNQIVLEGKRILQLSESQSSRSKKIINYLHSNLKYD